MLLAVVTLCRWRCEPGTGSDYSTILRLRRLIDALVLLCVCVRVRVRSRVGTTAGKPKPTKPEKSGDGALRALRALRALHTSFVGSLPPSLVCCR